MNEEYSIELWSIHFCKINKNGDLLLNKDGSVKMFFDNSTADYSYLFVDIDPDYLEEVTSDYMDLAT